MLLASRTHYRKNFLSTLTFHTNVSTKNTPIKKTFFYGDEPFLYSMI